MNTVKAIIVLFSAAVVVISDVEGKSDDYLTPAGQTDERTNAYHQLLEKKLGLTPFDCGRVLDTSSFGPETLESVYSRRGDPQRRYFVTLARPMQNLWKLTNGMHQPEKADGVVIEAAEAEIPEAAATAVREVLLHLLGHKREPTGSSLEFSMEGYLDLSIQRTNSQALSGQLRLPPSGPRTQSLVMISKELLEYCQADVSMRATLAHKIAGQANDLLKRLREKR